MAKRQTTLLSSWSAIPAKVRREELDNVPFKEAEDSVAEEADHSGDHWDSVDEEICHSASSGTQEAKDVSDYLNECDDESVNLEPEMEISASQSLETVSNRCTALCCSSSDKAFQPTDKQTLAKLRAKGRNFQPQWYMYKRFPWLSVCITTKKAYCL